GLTGTDIFIILYGYIIVTEAGNYIPSEYFREVAARAGVAQAAQLRKQMYSLHFMMTSETTPSLVAESPPPTQRHKQLDVVLVLFCWEFGLNVRMRMPSLWHGHYGMAYEVRSNYNVIKNSIVTMQYIPFCSLIFGLISYN
ncbi:hypothetical protein OTU49_001193, partial [Cherax quadricarinatus]